MKNILLKNKKAFIVRTWMVAFITGVALIGLCYLMVQGLATEYDNTAVIDPTFQSTYDKYSELQSNIDSMFEETSSPEGISIVGTFTTLFSSTFTVIQLVFSSLLFPGAMLRRLSLDIGAPSLIANIIFTLPLVIITVIIVMVVISSISRGKL